MVRLISTRQRPLMCLTGALCLAGMVPGTATRSTAARNAPSVSEVPAVLSGRNVVTVQVLAVNDLHGALLPNFSLAGRPAGGVASLAASLARARAAHPDRTIVVHVGDLVSASPALSGRLQDEPAVAVANAMGVTLGVVGNHEFDEGIPEFFRLYRGGSHPATQPLTGRFPGARFDMLGGNVLWKSTREPFLPPTKIIELAGIKIGFIGVVTADTPSSVGGGVAELIFLDEAATIRHAADQLRRQGVQAIVVLAHLGGVPSGTTIKGPVADLAHALGDAVDVILSGHTHRAYVTTFGGTLVTQAWPYGAGFIQLALAIDRVSGRVVAKNAEIVPVWADALSPDPTVAALVARYHALASPLLTTAISAAEQPVTRAPDSAGEQALGDLVADAYRWAMSADLAFAHPGWNWADLPAGELTWERLYLVQPANYEVVLLSMTGQQIAHVLEQQWLAGRTTQLQVAGLAVEVDPAAPLGQRISRLRLPDGTPLMPTASYQVAATSFLAGGGGGFTGFAEAPVRRVGPKDLAALLAYLGRQPQPIGRPASGRRYLTPALARMA